MHVKELTALYVRHCQVEKIHCPRTAAERQRTLEQFVQSAGELDVAELRPYHLTDFIEAHPEWQSAATRYLRAATVKACLQWAADGERIPRNPFKAVRYPEGERRGETPDEDLQRLLRAANKSLERALRWLRLTWCRAGELCGCQWEDLDTVKGLWTIDKHKTRKVTGREKIVVLTAEAQELLRDQGPGTGHVFRNSRGRPWNPNQLWKTTNALAERLGFTQRVTLHGIRHRGATEALGSDASLLLVSEQLGHTECSTTKKFYWHRSDAQNEAIRRVAELGGLKKPGRRATGLGA